MNTNKGNGTTGAAANTNNVHAVGDWAFTINGTDVAVTYRPTGVTRAGAYQLGDHGHGVYVEAGSEHAALNTCTWGTRGDLVASDCPDDQDERREVARRMLEDLENAVLVMAFDLTI